MPRLSLEVVGKTCSTAMSIAAHAIAWETTMLPLYYYLKISYVKYILLLSPIIQFLLTVTWIFGVTTVINWSDGMDGLAGGLTFISAMTFAASAIILSQPPSLLFSLMTAGSVLAFLFYNFFGSSI